MASLSAHRPVANVGVRLGIDVKSRTIEQSRQVPAPPCGGLLRRLDRARSLPNGHRESPCRYVQSPRVVDYRIWPAAGPRDRIEPPLRLLLGQFASPMASPRKPRPRTDSPLVLAGEEARATDSARSNHTTMTLVGVRDRGSSPPGTLGLQGAPSRICAPSPTGRPTSTGGSYRTGPLRGSDAAGGVSLTVWLVAWRRGRALPICRCAVVTWGRASQRLEG
jgi:hypothetical protein